MKTTGKVSKFCNEFTFDNHDVFEKVIERNHIRDCVNNVASKCKRTDENYQIVILCVLDDISLMIIDRKVKNFFIELNILKVDF